jgi:hypothetical protein
MGAGVGAGVAAGPGSGAEAWPWLPPEDLAGRWVEELEFGGVGGDRGRLSLGDLASRVRPDDDRRERPDVVGRAFADVGGGPDPRSAA